jgi:triosephosphate isomerase
MRRPLLIGNWKMNTSLDEALELARTSASVADSVQSRADVGVCPPVPWIVTVSELVKGSSLTIGAQDVSPESDGAFTGDVSAEMLSPWCQFVLIGHSERRTIHGESDEIVGYKLRGARERDLGVVLCVGETADQRAAGLAESTVTEQIEKALGGLSSIDGTSLTVAYEPVWAIGSGQAATVSDAQGMSAAIRGWLTMNHGGIADQVRVLYGGSVSDQNVRDFLEAPDIDGALVGGASLDPERFTALVTSAVGPR